MQKNPRATRSIYVHGRVGIGALCPDQQQIAYAVQKNPKATHNIYVSGRVGTIVHVVFIFQESWYNNSFYIVIHLSKLGNQF